MWIWHIEKNIKGQKKMPGSAKTDMKNAQFCKNVQWTFLGSDYERHARMRPAEPETRVILST
jgi:hypothetical protein